MAKKILLISSTWDTAYIGMLMQGMIRKLQNVDAQLFVFNAYDEALESEFHMMERAIYSLPDPREFDGILLAVNSVGNQSAVNELANAYKDLGIVVLSMELQMDGIPSIGTDNYHAQYDIVEHMIVEHGCKVLNYVGGPVEHLENKIRFRAFCDCLEAHGLTMDPERVENGPFRATDGVDAYHAFKKKGLHLPDAVICANDNMALGYCTAAHEDGFFAPGDFLISGFDNIENAQSYYPSITSIGRNWEDLGYSSIEQLLDMIDGKELNNTYFKGYSLVINESCGCCRNQRMYHHELTQFFEQKLTGLRMQALERQNRKFFSRSNTFDDLCEKIRLCEENSGTSKLALCINRSAFSITVDSKLDYDEEFMVYTDETSFLQFREDGLIPKNWCKDEQVFFFSPLHFSTVNFGYCVTPFNGKWNPDVDHRTLMESISLGLEGIRQHEYLRRANERLQDLYVRDALTGMYNRFGYENIAKDLYETLAGKVYAVYLDLDNLKPINDQYGHAMGDRAIIGLSYVIREVFMDKAVHVRMGGDEFLIIGECDGEENLLRKKLLLHERLRIYSEKSGLPFELSVSEGHICNAQRDLSLEQMIGIADKKMYEQKQRKKGRR